MNTEHDGNNRDLWGHDDSVAVSAVPDTPANHDFAESTIKEVLQNIPQQYHDLFANATRGMPKEAIAARGLELQKTLDEISKGNLDVSAPDGMDHIVNAAKQAKQEEQAVGQAAMGVLSFAAAPAFMIAGLNQSGHQEAKKSANGQQFDWKHYDNAADVLDVCAADMKRQLASIPLPPKQREAGVSV